MTKLCKMFCPDDLRSATGVYGDDEEELEEPEEPEEEEEEEAIN